MAPDEHRLSYVYFLLVTETVITGLSPRRNSRGQGLLRFPVNLCEGVGQVPHLASGGQPCNFSLEQPLQGAPKRSAPHMAQDGCEDPGQMNNSKLPLHHSPNISLLLRTWNLVHLTHLPKKIQGGGNNGLQRSSGVRCPASWQGHHNLATPPHGWHQCR